MRPCGEKRDRKHQVTLYERSAGVHAGKRRGDPVVGGEIQQSAEQLPLPQRRHADPEKSQQHPPRQRHLAGRPTAQKVDGGSGEQQPQRNPFRVRKLL